MVLDMPVEGLGHVPMVVCHQTTLPQTSEWIFQIWQSVSLIGVLSTWGYFIDGQHVFSMTLDFGVESVEVDVSDHLLRVDGFKPTQVPKTSK